MFYSANAYHQSSCEWMVTTSFEADIVNLTVKGIYQEPSPGYELYLEPVESQDSAHEVLVLTLTTVAPTEIEPEVITPTPVEYSRTYRLSSGKLPTKVTILPDRVTLDAIAA